MATLDDIAILLTELVELLKQDKALSSVQVQPAPVRSDKARRDAEARQRLEAADQRKRSKAHA